MTMQQAVADSIAAALERGTLDPKGHAALIEAVKQLAVKADEAKPNDNVTYPTLLKYLTAMGLTPEQPTPTKKAAKLSKTDKLKNKYRHARK